MMGFIRTLGILGFVFTLGYSVDGLAQTPPRDFSCDLSCTTSTDCDELCTDDGVYMTCRDFGICDSSGDWCVLDLCLLGACSRPSGGDGDCDGVPDPLEHDLAHRFFPDLRVQSQDVDEAYLARGRAIPYTVQPLAPRGVCDEAFECLEIRYGTAYTRDSGYNSHPGDSEFYAALVRRTSGWASASTDPSDWEMIRDFTAAHWRAAAGESSRFGAYGECLPNCAAWNNSQFQCGYASHCFWDPAECTGGYECLTHTESSCDWISNCYWDDYYGQCIDWNTGGTCTQHNQYSCSVQAQYYGCQFEPSTCVSGVRCYSASPLTGPRTVYAAAGKHALYHSKSECDAGGFLGWDTCPESNPAYSMRSDKEGRLQNVGWEDSSCVSQDTAIQHPSGCGLYDVWGGGRFSDSSSYESHFRYPLAWWLP